MATASTKDSYKLYKRLLQYVKPYWKRMVLAVISAILLAAANTSLAWIIKKVMDDVFADKNLKMLTVIPFAIVLLYFFKGLFHYGQSYFMGHVAIKVVTDLRNKIYQHLQTLSLAFFANNPTGVLISRIGNDTSLLQSTVSDSITSLLRNLLTIVGLTTYTFWVNWKLATISYLIIIWAIIPIQKFGKKSRRFSTKSQSKMADISKLIFETISGIRIVKAFCMEQYESRRFSKENRRFFRIRLKRLRIRALASPTMEMLGGIASAAILYYGGYNVIKGSMTTGDFFSFVAAFAMMYKPVRGLNKLNQTIQEGLAAAVRTFELLDLKADIVDKPNATELPVIKEQIEFRNICFQYDDVPILRNINLKVKVGEIIAIVGTSGAGKTTLANLIPRFYDVTSGALLIDGTDIRDVTLKSLRNQIGMVTQEIILFNDTIKNNISYGSLEKPDHEIIAAAKAAFAHEFIIANPEGYDSIIGERGVKLSGGQKQRIAIARALLKNAPILILDEATSSLDSQAEREVQVALEKLVEGRTTFIIAHRLSTIKKADRIIVFSDGRMVEEGTHNKLLALKGEYHKLYTMQYHGDDQLHQSDLLSTTGIT
ncbi:MAG: lipid A export permease/ATP-binding protein MsbA [Epsilonproteobacteria bacterium]|nr:MAG: lipid A export permease/ATP-binding protein MsbA [Campylobacterota bacterium]